MIYVLTRPKRLIEKIRYQINGELPAIFGDDIRYGGGVVEVVSWSTDSCTSVPMPDVARIVFDGGYKEAFDRVRNEANENAALQFKSMMPQVTASPSQDEESMPYTPTKISRDDASAYG